MKWDGKKWINLTNKTDSGYYLSLDVIPSASGTLNAEGNYMFDLEVNSAKFGTAFGVPQSYSFGTTIVGKNESYTFYESVTTGFSTFAITGQKIRASGQISTMGDLTAEQNGSPSTKPPTTMDSILYVIIILFIIAALCSLYIVIRSRSKK